MKDKSDGDNDIVGAVQYSASSAVMISLVSCNAAQCSAACCSAVQCRFFGIGAIICTSQEILPYVGFCI